MIASDRTSFDEKRNFLRMIDTPVKISLHSDELEPEGICRDLSGGGMLVEVQQALSLGAELDITLNVHNGYPLSAHARIIRIIEQPDSRYILGLEVVEIPQPLNHSDTSGTKKPHQHHLPCGFLMCLERS